MSDTNNQIYKFDVSSGATILFNMAFLNVQEVQDFDGTLLITLTNGTTVTRFSHDGYMEFVISPKTITNNRLFVSVDRDVVVTQISEDKFKISDVYVQSHDGRVDNYDNWFVFDSGNSDAMRFTISTNSEIVQQSSKPVEIFTQRNGRVLNIDGLPNGVTERKDRRSEASACFDNGDGSFTQLCYSAPIHYHDGGDWQEIDTRWKTCDELNWDWEMLDADYHAHVSTRFNSPGDLLKLECHGYYLTYEPLGLGWSNEDNDWQIISEPQSVDGVTYEVGVDKLSPGGYISWAGAYGEGMDFTFTPKPQQFLKHLTVDQLNRFGQIPDGYADKSPVITLRWLFDTDLDLWLDGDKWDGLSVSETGSFIEFKDTFGEVHWSWKTPEAIDAEGNIQIGTVRVAEIDGKVSVGVVIPWTWLETAIYPVVIDPTVNYNYNGVGLGLDGHMYRQHATYLGAFNNNSRDGTCRVGQKYYFSTYWRWRALLAFDTSSITGYITGIDMILYCTSNADGLGFNLDIRKYNFPDDWAYANADNAAEASSERTFSSAYVVENSYYTVTNLDTTYIKTGAGSKTKYSLTSYSDISNQTPVGDEYLEFTTSTHGSDEPFLSVTWIETIVSKFTGLYQLMGVSHIMHNVAPVYPVYDKEVIITEIIYDNYNSISVSDGETWVYTAVPGEFYNNKPIFENNNDTTKVAWWSGTCWFISAVLYGGNQYAGNYTDSYGLPTTEWHTSPNIGLQGVGYYYFGIGNFTDGHFNYFNGVGLTWSVDHWVGPIFMRCGANRPYLQDGDIFAP